MAYTNKRVGISYISDKENLSDLYNEEILVDKSTGEMLIKTPVVGNVISYNYHTRFSEHVNRMITKSFEHSILNCDVTRIDPNGMSFPTISPIGVNLVDDGVTINHGVASLMVSLDIDKLIISDGMISETPDYDLNIEYSIKSYYIGEERETYTGTMSLHDLNSHVFHFKERCDSVVIDRLYIAPTDEVDTRNILHSILLLYDNNGFYRVVELRVAQQHTNAQIAGYEFDPTGLIVEGVTDIGTVVNIDDYTYTIEYIGGDS